MSDDNHYLIRLNNPNPVFSMNIACVNINCCLLNISNIIVHMTDHGMHFTAHPTVFKNKIPSILCWLPAYIIM